MYITSKIQVTPLHPNFPHGLQCPPSALCPTESAAGASLSCLPHPCLGNLQEFNTFEVAAPVPHLTKGAVWEGSDTQTRGQDIPDPWRNWGPWELWLCAASPVLTSRRIWQTLVTVVTLVPESKSKLRGFPEMCNWSVPGKENISSLILQLREWQRENKHCKKGGLSGRENPGRFTSVLPSGRQLPTPVPESFCNFLLFNYAETTANACNTNLT